jgi:SNF2 family DNA or RNA helicase
VCLTSYQMAVADEAVLKKVKWQFMILDEAQVGRQLELPSQR